MTGRAPDRRSSSTARENDLLARLGLGAGASNGQVEAAHDEILDFLATAPGGLRDWAELQLTDADEAYAQLNGAPASGTTTAAPLREDRATASPAASFNAGFDEQYGASEPEADTAVGPRHARSEGNASVRVRGRARPPAQRDAGRQSSTTVTISRSTLRRGVVIGTAGIVTLAIALGVYGFGGPSVPGLTGTPKPQASAGVDAAQISALMERVAANDKDVDALNGLANLYYDSGDYATAETWLGKVLAIEPENVTALLTLGAAQYNSGDETSAEGNWRKALVIEPDNIEAHYDLGFMYFSQEPPNLDGARLEWGKVVELAPESDLAQTVAAHLTALSSFAPGGSAAPAGSGSPSPSVAPAASSTPAPSAAGSGN